VEEHRVLAVLGQPALGVLELLRGIGGTAVRKQRDQRRIPVPSRLRTMMSAASRSPPSARKLLAPARAIFGSRCSAR